MNARNENLQRNQQEKNIIHSCGLKTNSMPPDYKKIKTFQIAVEQVRRSQKRSPQGLSILLRL